METYEAYQIAGRAIWLVFIFAFGACAGSLINVLVYRLPLGLGVVTPPSRCPACETKLTWRENIPVLGWIILRGRCRFCRSRISAEYPLVEAFVGLLLVITFVLWYQVPAGTEFLGIDWGSIRPEWARFDAREGWPRYTWPEFIALALLLCSLVAMTIVDAKTFTIPLQLPWFAAIVGLIFHVGHAIYLSIIHQPLPSTAPGWIWAIPTPGGRSPANAGAWWWIGASIGGIVGIGLATLAVEMGWMRRSFADYAEWESKALADLRAKHGQATDPVPSADQSAALKPTDARRPPPRFFGPLCAFVLVFGVLAAAGHYLAPLVRLSRTATLPQWSGLLAGALIAPILAGIIGARQNKNAASVVTADAIKHPAPDGVVAIDSGHTRPSHSADAAPTAGSPDMWIEYPHARREMLRELLFLTPCLVLGGLGGFIAARTGAGTVPPLWILVLAGVLMGYLIGGGLIWAVRIFGSLGFGREAMGLGDVHLMAGVGAVVGWIDAVLALPIAAVVGLYWAVAGGLIGGGIRKAMPFGPYLAVGTMVVIFAKPLIEAGLTLLMGGGPPPAPIPPINLP